MDKLFIIDERKTYQRLNFIEDQVLDITLPKLVDDLHDYNINFDIGTFTVTFRILNYKVVGPNRTRLQVKLVRSNAPVARDLRTFIESYYDFIIVSPANPLSYHQVYGKMEDLYNYDLKDRLVGYWTPIDQSVILVPIQELGIRNIHYVDTSTGELGEVGREQLNVVDDNYVINVKWFHIYYI